MTRPDRESRFDDVDLTTLTIVELEDYLSKIVDRHVIIPDPFLARAYELRIVDVQRHVQREVAIRNRRETERQDGMSPAVSDAEVILAAAGRRYDHGAERARAETRAYAIRIIGGYVGAGLSSASTEAAANAIADRVADLLTAPPPGHVCPAPYALEPEDLDALSELQSLAELSDWPRARAVLAQILAAHRAPEPAAGPLLEVIACGTAGCVSSIRKSYLPSGWVSIDGAWRCPRCKLEVPS